MSAAKYCALSRTADCTRDARKPAPRTGSVACIREHGYGIIDSVSRGRGRGFGDGERGGAVWQYVIRPPQSDAEQHAVAEACRMAELAEVTHLLSLMGCDDAEIRSRLELRRAELAGGVA